MACKRAISPSGCELPSGGAMTPAGNAVAIGGGSAAAADGNADDEEDEDGVAKHLRQRAASRF